MLGHSWLLCKRNGCHGDFTNSVECIFVWQRLCCTNLIKYQNKKKEKNPCKVVNDTKKLLMFLLPWQPLIRFTMLNLFGDSLKVILKYYLLPITSILMFKYFVQNQQFKCSVVDCCYAKKLVATEILWFFSTSVESINVWHTLVVHYKFDQMW